MAAEQRLVDLETAMAESVVQVLTPIVGADHVKSSVTIEYDPTSGESTQDVYDPKSAAVVTSQISQETRGRIWIPPEFPGPPATPPTLRPPATAANQAEYGQTTQGIRSENKTFAVSHTTHHLVEPAGRFKRRRGRDPSGRRRRSQGRQTARPARRAANALRKK